MFKRFLFASSLLVSGFTFAETENVGYFIGGYLGSVQGHESVSGVDYEEGGNSHGLITGYHFTPNLGVEGRVEHGVHSNFVTISVSFGPKLTVALSEKVSVYGKLGLAAGLLSDDDEEDSDQEGYWDNQSGFGYTAGLGINFALSEHFVLRTSYDYLEINLEDADNVVEDFDLGLSYLSLGFYYQY